MRVLFTSITELGHIHPMIPLARAAMDRGWDVVWATGADACPRIERAGIKAVPAGLDSSERRKRRAAHLDIGRIPPAEMADHTFPLFATIAAPPMLEDLIDVTRAWAPDLVVHEVAEFAGPIVAAAMGVPSVCHSYGPLTPRHRVARAGEEVAPLWASMGLDAPPYGGSYEWLYLDIYPKGLQPSDMTHVPRRQALRPMPPEETAAEEENSTWAVGEDLIYLTFGTVSANRPALLAALQAIAPLGLPLLVTVGPGGDPSTVGDRPSNVRVERYVPQSSVFPRCRLVVSHGGSGTFLGAASNAIPQLCLPQAADQFLNAQVCVDSGIGLSLHPDAASEDALRDAVQRLLSESEFGSRARAVAAELAGMPSPEEVLSVLETLTI